MHIAIIVLLSFLSCNKASKMDVQSLSSRWIATESIEFEQNFVLNKLVEKPKNILNPLMKIGFFNYNGETIYDCLYYKPASQSKSGIFKVIKNPSNISCQKIAYDKSFFSVEEVYNFKINITNNTLELYFDKDLYKFTMLNYGSYLNSIYKEPIRDTQFKGVSYYSNIKESSLEKRVKTKDGTSCLKVNDFCESSKDTCAKCKSGWYEVMDSACRDKYSRVCGIDKCGTKDNPACIRGVATVGLDTKFYCVNDSPFGFCQKGLRVMCLNDLLVCI